LSEYAAAQGLFIQAAIALGRDAGELDYSVWKYMSEKEARLTNVSKACRTSSNLPFGEIAGPTAPAIESE